MSRSRADELRGFFPKVYQQYGPLNARQYAYRAEAEGIIPKSRSAFNQANSILVELREDEILPWGAVLDSSREFSPWQANGSEDPDNHLKTAAKMFLDVAKPSLPRWHGQPVIPVILTEKEGLVPYFEHIAMDKQVSVYPIKGQAGKSHLHEEFAPWVAELVSNGRKVKILYLGDCDDEGFQIPLTLMHTLSRWLGRPKFDVKDLYPRTESEIHYENSALAFQRLALKPSQVESEGLPRDPVNPRSTISKKFVDYKSELEALDPDLLRGLIRQAIEDCFDSVTSAKRKKMEDKLKKEIDSRIKDLTRNWPEDWKESLS